MRYVPSGIEIEIKSIDDLEKALDLINQAEIDKRLIHGVVEYIRDQLKPKVRHESHPNWETYDYGTHTHTIDFGTATYKVTRFPKRIYITSKPDESLNPDEFVQPVKNQPYFVKIEFQETEKCVSTNPRSMPSFLTTPKFINGNSNVNGMEQRLFER